jgi:hypothetical protein
MKKAYAVLTFQKHSLGYFSTALLQYRFDKVMAMRRATRLVENQCLRNFSK